MEELKLEEIAPYLPYGLMCKTKIHDGLNKDLILRLDGLLNGYARFNHKRDWVNQSLSEFKPLLYPLSMLVEFLENIGHAEDYETEWIEHFLDFRDKPNEANLSACPYELMLHILENHFDINNLIPKGLAIDKSTIKNEV